MFMSCWIEQMLQGKKMEEYLRHLGAEEVEVTTIEGPKGKTDMIRVTIPGTNGKSAGGKALH